MILLELTYMPVVNYLVNFDSSITLNRIVDFVNNFGGSHFRGSTQIHLPNLKLSHAGEKLLHTEEYNPC